MEIPLYETEADTLLRQFWEKVKCKNYKQNARRKKGSQNTKQPEIIRETKTTNRKQGKMQKQGNKKRTIKEMMEPKQKVRSRKHISKHSNE